MYVMTPEIQKWADEVWQKIDDKMSVVTPRTIGKIPYTTVDNVYDDKSDPDQVNWWTNGFWGAWQWLMYVGTKKEIYKQAAEKLEEQMDAALANYDRLDHDVGFLWHITAGVNYRLTGNKESRRRALFAAATLASRFNEKGQFIRAWNGGDRQGWAIIDCMMNVPLLYWASRELDDPRFAFIGKAHADTTLANHLREDGSVRHIVVYDHENGGMVSEIGGQGFGEGSSWSRGQAWGLYGYALSYIHTGDSRYLNAAKRIANYFITSVADTGYLPLCDFRAPLEPVIYDSTAGAIAACGMIELAKILNENEGRVYLNAALKILKAMEENWCDWDIAHDAILGMGTEAYHKSTGKEVPIIYGDYYFAQAIYKLKDLGPLFE